MVRGGGNGPSVGARAIVCASHARETGLLKLLAHSSVVGMAFRDASIGSEARLDDLSLGSWSFKAWSLTSWGGKVGEK